MTKAEGWRLVECCLRASQGRLTPADLDWLLAERQRALYFDAVMALRFEDADIVQVQH